jgi:CheY-like chemotaxis protein
VTNSNPSAAANAPAPVPGAAKAGLRVLVIDDSDADRRLTIHHLGEVWPFEREMIVETAADGKEALEKIRKLRLALIVLDWKLPLGGDGEVLRTMRRGGIRVPVIVLSGLQREDIRDDLEALGAAFLNKNDMTPMSLRDAITNSLRLLGVPQPPPRQPAA